MLDMSISIRFRKDRNQWGVFQRVGNRRTSKYFGGGDEGKAKAERFAMLLRSEESRKDQWMVGAEMPVDDTLLGWLDTHRATLARSTEATATGLIENHLIPFFGGRDLRTVTETDLIEFADSTMTRGLSSAVVTNALSLLRRVCSLHVKAGLLTSNPAAGCKALVGQVSQRHEPPKREVDSWTQEEARELLVLAAEREKFLLPALELAFATGMRRGELLGLTWADVDFRRKRLTVRRSLVRGHITQPKSKRMRTIPLSPTLAMTLKALRAEQKKSAPWSPESAVVAAPMGGRWEEANFARAWRRLRNRSDVRPLAFHCTRHTFATLALEAGRSIKWVANILGHADATTTLRVYAHALDAGDEGLEFVDSLLGTQMAPNGTQK